MIALMLGIVLGNVLIGIPIDAEGNFTGGVLYFLNPYAILVGVTTLALFMMRPFGGSGVDGLIPATCKAFEFPKPMWPSRSSRYTGRSEITASIYFLSTFWSGKAE